MSKNKTSQIISKPDNKIVMYTDKRGNVELQADALKETLWATQLQIARIFGTTIPNINIHLKRIYKDGELKEGTTIKESLIVLKNSRQYLTKFYNLDVIIAVGYRVNSKRATRFRIWATRVLREYLIRGFAVRQKKLARPEQNFDNLQEALTFMESKSQGGPVKARLSLRLYKDVMK